VPNSVDRICFPGRCRSIALRILASRKPGVTILGYPSNACVQPLKAADKTFCAFARDASTFRNEGAPKSFALTATTHHHFGPHPDTLLFLIVTSGPRFAKKVGPNVLSLRQVFSIVKWFTGSVGVVLLVSLQMPYSVFPVAIAESMLIHSVVRKVGSEWAIAMPVRPFPKLPVVGSELFIEMCCTPSMLMPSPELFFTVLSIKEI
jgi:hypothetical protein